jgi:hypothetical protein
MTIHVVTPKDVEAQNFKDYSEGRRQANEWQKARWDAQIEQARIAGNAYQDKENQRIAAQELAERKSRIATKHKSFTIWKLPMLIKKIDRIRLHMTMFLLYSGCVAVVGIAVTGVFWVWRMVFMSAMTVVN